MCGIAGFTGKKNSKLLLGMLKSIKHRGPDETTTLNINGINAGMNRLAIVDLHKKLYPMIYKNLALLFNGEIYNYQELRMVISKYHCHSDTVTPEKNPLQRRSFANAQDDKRLAQDDKRLAQDDKRLVRDDEKEARNDKWFKTNSDAEVILPLFDLYGPKAFSMLEAMFAIFIYDKKEKIIYLARDKMGEKSMYYCKNDNVFAFGSEMKAILTSGKKHLAVSNRQVAKYLYQSYVEAPNTIIKGIKKIPAGHYLKYDLKRKKISLNQYFKPITICHLERSERSSEQSERFTLLPRHSSGFARFLSLDNARDRNDDKAFLIKELNSLIQQSVKSRLVADVPLGCFLSGGMDSSLITYWAAKYKKGLKTFSITFPGFEKHDESKYANIAAKLCHTKHTEVDCTANKIRKVINNIGQIIDEPIIDAAVLPLYLLAERAKKDLTVVLTGEGADELFAGYNRYQYELGINYCKNFINKNPSVLKIANYIFPNHFKRLKSSIFGHYQPDVIWDKEELKKLLLSKSFSLDFARDQDDKGLSQDVKKSTQDDNIYKDNKLLSMQLTDLRGFLPERLLMKADKITMFHSLEARCPYLDSKIINFALNLPSNLKIKGFTGKYLLKKVAEKYLPKNIVWRKKHGFTVPLNLWFKNELKDIVYDSVKDIKKYSWLFNRQYYQFIVNQHLDNQADHADQIWGMIVLMKFMKTHGIISHFERTLA